MKHISYKDRYPMTGRPRIITDTRQMGLLTCNKRVSCTAPDKRGQQR